MEKNNKLLIPQLALISFFVTGLLYFLFFQLQGSIVNASRATAQMEYTPWLLPFVAERDGYELYALYALVLINAISVFVLSVIMTNIRNIVAKIIFYALFSFVIVLFFMKVGFNLPMATKGILADPALFSGAVALVIKLTIVTSLLILLSTFSKNAADAAVALLMIPICFIPFDRWHHGDYDYVFAPALRLLHGIPLAETYFQYDALLSLLVAGWVKIGFSLENFYILVQISYFLLIFGLFVIMRKMFYDKRIAFFMLFALIITKIYANMFNPTAVIQVTPLRLDIWIVIFALSYFMGIYSIAPAIAIGFFLIFSNTFGIVFAFAYLQAIAVLFLIKISEIIFLKSKEKSVKVLLLEQIQLNYRNIIIIIVAYLLFMVIFNKFSPEAASLFIQSGNGFLPISQISFYWYLLPFYGISFTLLMKLNKELEERYFSNAILLLFISLNASVYFFGRSHENNILNIAAALLPAIFITFDLTAKKISLLEKQNKKNYYLYGLIAGYVLPLSVLLVLTVGYSDKINSAMQGQKINFNARDFKQLSTAELKGMDEDLEIIKQVTNNSKKIFIAGTKFDSLMYYRGGYVPPRYFAHFFAWYDANDLRRSMQILLDDGYYIVYERNDYLDQLLAPVRCNNGVQKQNLKFLWKD